MPAHFLPRSLLGTPARGWAIALLLGVASAGAAAPWQRLERGEFKPHGRMLHQMERDLTTGILSAYPELRGLGALIGDNPDRAYYEPEGNYCDALVRNAFLTGNADAMAKARHIMATALASRLPNGYFGGGAVRSPADIRKSNIELWSQCCFLRGALAYAAYAADPTVLTAVRKNVDRGVCS